MRIATRSSRLAMAQARAVADGLPGQAELVAISTRGDRARRPLAAIGGKGLFTAELEAALRSGQVQLAVHSAKDLPADMPQDMVIAAVPAREDPRDALVTASGATLNDLAGSARIGTSSLRRAWQLQWLRPGLRAEPIRGNLQTRLRKLRRGEYEALLLALAGLKRLGLLEPLGPAVCPLPVEQFVPAAGQGALAVQCLAADAAARELASAVNDPESAAALAAERGVVRGLGASCRSAVGVHVRREGGGWLATGLVAAAEGRQVIRLSVPGPTAQAAGEALLARLIEAGAGKLLSR